LSPGEEQRACRGRQRCRHARSTLGRQGERLHRELGLTPHPQRSPGGHEHGQARAGRGQGDDLGCGGDQVLEVVQHQQVPQRSQVLRNGGLRVHRVEVGDAQRAADRRHHQGGSRQCGEGDERRPVREGAIEGAGDRHGEPGLPDPAGARQRHQRRVGALQDLRQRGDFSCAADQCRRRRATRSTARTLA
jgi:hypothetical protein